MTREQAKEILPIIQSFVEGKAIQDKIEGVTGWCDTDEINFEFEGQKIIHRIKPESHRPFENQEECWNEMMKHEPFGWIEHKETKEYYNIVGICKISANTNIFMRGFSCAFTELFDEFIFIDGTPFGIKI